MQVGGSGATIGCQESSQTGAHTTQYACDVTNNNAPASGTMLTFDCPVGPIPGVSLSLSAGGGFPGDTLVAGDGAPGHPCGPPVRRYARRLGHQRRDGHAL